MSLATYLRDRLPSAFVRAAALGLVVLALAAYGVESGVLAFVTVAFLAGEAAALLLDFWRRRGFYRRLDRTMEGLGEHSVGYLAPELTQEPSTLEEAAFADVIVKVADAGDAQAAEQLAVTDEVLGSLECADIPQLVVYNKCDTANTVAFDPDILLTSAKTGYGKYDEGMALLSKKPIAQVQQFLTSKTDDYENWKTRRILGIQPEGSSGWFFTIHMGWWNDEEEPFVDQWKCIQETLKDPKYREGTIWLMGDFNSQDDVRTSNVICNGKNAPVVSDHYGVMITV